MRVGNKNERGRKRERERNEKKKRKRSRNVHETMTNRFIEIEMKENRRDIDSFDRISKIINGKVGEGEEKRDKEELEKKKQGRSSLKTEAPCTYYFQSLGKR